MKINSGMEERSVVKFSDLRPVRKQITLAFYHFKKKAEGLTGSCKDRVPLP